MYARWPKLPDPNERIVEANAYLRRMIKMLRDREKYTSSRIIRRNVQNGCSTFQRIIRKSIKTPTRLWLLSKKTYKRILEKYELIPKLIKVFTKRKMKVEISFWPWKQSTC